MPDRAVGKTYGTVAAERQKEMSGLQFVQGLVDGTLPITHATTFASLRIAAARARSDAGETSSNVARSPRSPAAAICIPRSMITFRPCTIAIRLRSWPASLTTR